MSSKLMFQVIHVSGNEEGYLPKELQVHSPTTKGWLSTRFCIYPQEVILCLKEPSYVSKLQILSHQYNIASKIEVFISMPSIPGSPSLVGCKFKRLGYVQMSTNEGTDYTARELKSVHVNADCQLIKLLFHKNHVNRLNLYNQVGVVAVNVLGQSLSQKYEDLPPPKTEDLLTHYLNHVNVNDSYLNPSPLKYSRYQDGTIVSPLDDLSFDMYQDPETAQLIRRLDEKKRQAILEERYDYAKKLKQAMADLYKVGERLGKFEVEKRRAVDMENFDLAKSKKIQGDEYRLHVYQQLDIYDLLEIKRNLVKEDNAPKIQAPFHSHEEPQSSRHTPPEHHADLKLPPLKAAHTNQQTNKQTNSETMNLPTTTSPISSPKNISHSDQNDERPLPALKSKSTVEITVDDHETVMEDNEYELPVLTEKEERDAELVINVFGMGKAKQLYSKSWKHRQESVTSLLNDLSQTDFTIEDHTPREISRASVVILQKSLQDQVYVVLQNSVELLKTLLNIYIPKTSLGKSEITFVIDKLLPALLRRTSDMAPRTRSIMADTIVEIAKEPSIKNLGIVPSLLTEALKKKKQPPWRLLKSQIEIIHTLIKDLGIDKHGGFNIDSVMKILADGFENANNEVRDASLSCIIDIYKIVKDPIKKYFPPDQPSTRKNPLYVKLYDGFDRADGKLTESERKTAVKKQKEDADKSKAEEIKALQAQLKELRSVANTQLEEQTTNGGEHPNDDTPKSKNSKSKTNIKQASVRKMKEPVKREAKPKSRQKDGTNLPSEKLCIFCGEENEAFNEEGLDVHYWKSCPMLKRCDSCLQVVEISSMSDHLISECERKDVYTKCKMCSVVMKATEEKQHIDSQRCEEFRNAKTSSSCPMCKQAVVTGDESWKHHLMELCKPNINRLKEAKSPPKTTKSIPIRDKDKARPGNRPSHTSTRVGENVGRGKGPVSKLPTRTPIKKK